MSRNVTESGEISVFGSGVGWISTKCTGNAHKGADVGIFTDDDGDLVRFCIPRKDIPPASSLFLFSHIHAVVGAVPLQFG